MKTSPILSGLSMKTTWKRSPNSSAVSPMQESSGRGEPRTPRRHDGRHSHRSHRCLSCRLHRKLGVAADYPSTDDLNEVLPGIIERHGIPATRIMPQRRSRRGPAAAIIREILNLTKHSAFRRLKQVQLFQRAMTTTLATVTRSKLAVKRPKQKSRPRLERDASASAAKGR